MGDTGGYGVASKSQVVGLRWSFGHELDHLGSCSGGGKPHSVGLLP